MATKKFFEIEFKGGSDLIRQIADVELEMKELAKAIAAAKKAGDGEAYKKLRVEQESLRKTTGELKKELRESVTEFEKQKYPTDSLVAMRTEYSKLIKEIGQLSKAQRESAEGLDKIKLAGNLKKEILEIDQASGNFFSNIGNYKSAFESVFPLLSNFGSQLSGITETIIGLATASKLVEDPIELDLQVNDNGASNALDLIKGGAKSALGAIRALFATPLGWIIAIGAAIGGAVNEWATYNTEILEAKKQTQDITGLSGKAAVAIRSQALAISEVTGTSLEDGLNAAKVAVNNFGIDYNEALNVIQNGLVDAGNKQEIFLESLTEYSTFFGQAGFSFQEFASIINSGVDLGIYTDKLPDAIKEFSISITEQTKASRDALENAFGRDFSDRILSSVKSEELSVKDALGEIAVEAERVGINLQQAQQLTTDLFRGAGEDVGGALKIFEAVNIALGEQPKILSDIQKAQNQSIEITTRLNQAQANALETDSFAEFQQMFSNLWKEAQILWYEFVEGFVNVFNRLVDDVEIGIAGWTGLFKGIPLGFEVVKKGLFDIFKGIGESASRLGTVLQAAFSLDLKATKAAFTEFKKSLSDVGILANSLGSKVDKAITDSVLGSKEKAKQDIAERRKLLVEQKKYEDKVKADAIRNAEEEKRLEEERLKNKKIAQERYKKLVEDQSKSIAENEKKIQELTAKTINNVFDKQIAENNNRASERIKKLEEQSKLLEEKIAFQGGKSTADDNKQSGLIQEETKAINAALDQQNKAVNEKRKEAFTNAKLQLESLQRDNLKAIASLSIQDSTGKISDIKQKSSRTIQTIELKYDQDQNDLDNLFANNLVSQEEYTRKSKALELGKQTERLDIEKSTNQKILDEQERLYKIQLELIKATENIAISKIDEDLFRDQEKAYEDFKSGRIASKEDLQKTLDALDNKANNERAQVVQDSADKEKDAINSVLDAKIAASETISKIDKEQSAEQILENKKRAEELEFLRQKAIEVAQNISDTIFEITNRNAEKEKETKLNELEEEYAKKIELAQGNKTLEEALKAELEAKKLEIEKKAFERQKKLQIAQALINAAVAATAIFTVPDFTFGIATAAKLAALAITTATSIASIKKQQFADGGKIPTLTDGKIRINPNAPTTAKGDNIVAYVKRGEVILNEDQQEAAGGPEFFRRLNVPGFAEGGRVPNITGVGSSQRGVGITDEQMMMFANIVANQTFEAVYKGSAYGASDGTFKGQQDIIGFNQKRESLQLNTEF